MSSNCPSVTSLTRACRTRCFSSLLWISSIRQCPTACSQQGTAHQSGTSPDCGSVDRTSSSDRSSLLRLSIAHTKSLTAAPPSSCRRPCFQLWPFSPVHASIPVPMFKPIGSDTNVDGANVSLTLCTIFTVEQGSRPSAGIGTLENEE